MKWRPRYRLRTLLAVVTACAVLFACYFQLWPSWRLSREQSLFEQSARQIKAGTPYRRDVMLEAKTAARFYVGPVRNNAGESVFAGVYSWENVCYCISYILREAGYPRFGETERIEVYRLPPMPPGFKPVHTFGSYDPLHAYALDWLQKTYSQPPQPFPNANAQGWLQKTYVYSQQPGPTGQLIYSDPPVKQ